MIPDSFAQLGLPRRPYLAEEAVRDAFHLLAAERHPDKTGGESGPFAELTAAFEIVRNPVTRLKHLIDLEGLVAAATAPSVPEDLMELFPAVAQTCRQLAAATEKHRAAPNALARSLAAADFAPARRDAQQLNARLDDLYRASLDELRRIDADWPDPASGRALPALHSRLAYLTRWREQLREFLLQLQLT